ncbi:MAG: chemotaxis-specific protein-glutamate methyltransferase CheB [Myxococcales bacterium]|nr:chemotaxis-specific protein-glutamate methyltransferase CheB [Myxococcales bacterium]
MSIRVAYVDDSATARALLHELLESMPGVTVAAGADDAFTAWTMIKKCKPTVLVMDVNMPRMSGIEFVRKLMKHVPLPVVLVSGTRDQASALTLEALNAGAVDFVSKPDGKGVSKEMFSRRLTRAVYAAARSNVGAPPPAEAFAAPSASPAICFDTRRTIAIGASTGGTQALITFLRQLPGNCPPVAIVQHMPSPQTRHFATHLDEACAVRVMEAKSGQKLERGLVLIAPGSHHMELVGAPGGLVTRLTSGPEVSGHRPSVNMLFRSCVRSDAKKFSAAILTGMGSDGAMGMKELHDAGARTFAQDEKSCVVFGMPKAAISAGAVDTVAPLDELAAHVLDSCRR